MMILSDPAITLDGVTKLGRQMAQLFRQVTVPNELASKISMILFYV